MIGLCRDCPDPFLCVERGRCQSLQSYRWAVPIDYDRLARAVVAEQRRESEETKREDIKELQKLLPYFTGEKTGLCWQKHLAVADAIRAYIKAEAA